MFKQIVNLGITEGISEERKFQLKVRNFLALIIILAVSNYIGVHFLLKDDKTIFWTYLVYYLAATSLLYAHYHQRFTLGEYIITLFIPLAFFNSCIFLGKEYHAEYLLFITGVSSCYMFEQLEKRKTIRKRIFLFHILLFITIKIYYYHNPYGIVSLNGSVTVVFNLLNSLAAFLTIYRIVSASFYFREELYDKLHQLSTQQEQIIQERTREIRRFAYISAHDLREPLRNIIGFSQLLHRDVKAGKSEHLEEYLGFISSGIQKIDTLTKDIVNYTELEHHIPIVQEVDTQKIIQTIIDGYQNHPKPIQFKYTSLPIIRMNRKLCMLLFSNLIENAVTYCDKPYPKVTINCTTMDDTYQFAIIDNGKGISEKYFDTIFVMFKRLQKDIAATSSGIGLAICKKIITAYHGKIWVASKEKEGSTFYFSLPK